MYAQYDGYPSGHGAELKDKLGRLTLVNGLTGSSDVANGMGCFAAQLVAAFKDKPGGFYLYKPGARDFGEEYCYRIFPHDGIIRLEVFSGPVTAFGLASEAGANKPIWEGPLADFDHEAAESNDTE